MNDFCDFCRRWKRTATNWRVGEFENGSVDYIVRE